MRCVDDDDIFNVLQYHAYLLSNVKSILDNNKSHYSDNNGQRVYRCKQAIQKKTVVSLKQFLNAPKIGILKLHCLILEHVLVLILQKVFPPLHQLI